LSNSSNNNPQIDYRGGGIALRPKNPKPQYKVRLNPLLWQTFKLECKKQGLKPNQVLEALIEAYLTNPLLPVLVSLNCKNKKIG